MSGYGKSFHGTHKASDFLYGWHHTYPVSHVAPLHSSVNKPFKGDYLEISKNPKYQKLNSAVDEKVLLADVVNKINRANGKVREESPTHALQHLLFSLLYLQ